MFTEHLKPLQTFVVVGVGSLGVQRGRHQAGGPVRRREGRDPPPVSRRLPRDLHALDGGADGQQVSLPREGCDGCVILI